MRLFGRISGSVDDSARAQWLTPPFDLALSGPAWLDVTPSVQMLSAAGLARLSLTVTDSSGVDPAVFVFLLGTLDPTTGVRNASFQKIALPVDLEALPPDCPFPDASPPRFRLPSVTLDFRSMADTLSTRDLILRQVQGLLDDVTTMGQLAPDMPTVLTASGAYATLVSY